MRQVKPIPETQTSTSIPDASPEDIDGALAYEKIFVPALFQSWPPLVIDAAGVQRGDRVLDIACGTGVLTRELPAIVGDATTPIGLDISPGMLTVANRLNPDIDWRQGDAGALPFPDESFDRVLCQYGLMLFPDPVLTLKEMLRVLRPGGRMALAVWDTLDNNPGYAEKVEILDRISGTPAGDALRAPFCLGDREQLQDLVRQAGVNNFELRTHGGEAKFADLHQFVEADLRGWLPVMGVHLSEDEIATIHDECKNQLEHYVDPAGGSFRMPASAHIFTGSR